MNTNTIPQRLREIAVRIGTLDMAAYVQLRAIANELEAPAADAVPVVAYQKPRTVGCVRIDSDEVHLYPLIRDREQAGLRDGELLVSARDHLAAVAALKERINALEARQVPDGSAPITQQKLADLIQEGFMAGAKRGIETAVKDMLAKGWSPPQSSQPDTSKEKP